MRIHEVRKYREPAGNRPIIADRREPVGRPLKLACLPNTVRGSRAKGTEMPFAARIRPQLIHAGAYQDCYHWRPLKPRWKSCAV